MSLDIEHDSLKRGITEFLSCALFPLHILHENNVGGTEHLFLGDFDSYILV